MTRPGRFDRFLEALPRHAGLVLAAAALVTLAAVASVVDLRSGTLRLTIDPSSDRLLPEDDAARRFFDRVQTVFGADEVLLVALASEDVFRPEDLERLERVTRRLSALDGVDRVLSLTNAVSVRGSSEGVAIAPFVQEGERDPQALAALRREVLADPLVGGSLVSADGRVAAVLVYFVEMTNREFLQRGLDEAVTGIAREEGRGAQVWVTGGPHIRAETARILLGETFTLSLGILAALGGVLALSFRTFRGVALPLATISVAVTWTLGLVAWWGEPLNAVTSLVPPLMTALGLSYSVHVVSEYYEVLREAGGQGDARALTGRATRAVALPVALTGLTTAVGFASLALSPVEAVREFGALSVFGVVATLVASLTVTPAGLALLPRPRHMPPASGGRHGVTVDRLAERVARFDVAHRRAIYAGAALLLVLAAVGASRLRIGTQQIGKFPADSRVRTDFEAVDAALGGANPFYVVLESDAPDTFKEPANLRALAALQDWLRARPEIGATASLADFVKLIHRGFREGDPAEERIPDSRRLIGQLLFFAGGDELDRYVDARYQMASIHVRAHVIDSDDVAALAGRIEERLSELPGHLRGAVTGTSVVLTRALQDVMRGQAWSIVVAFGIIYGILSAMFLSWRIGAVALLPNVVPVAAYFGALGFLGIRLDPGTSLVAPMVLGIAVDDTIHYFARYIRAARGRGDESQAAVTALKEVARPATYTSLALCAGFAVLTTSELRSQVELGAMAAFALATAWTTDMVLTPALCARLRVVSIWDYLALDLGPEPQRAIALLRGLRASRARLVALCGELVRLSAGDRVFAQDEPGGSVYAVVDGQLVASVRPGGRRLVVGEYGRGDVVGEVGLFHGRRPADLDARTDVTLLRLTEGSLDGLARRSPRTATVVYRNLVALAAERWSEVRARALEGAGPEPVAREAGPDGDPARAAALVALADAFFAHAPGERVELRRLEQAHVGAARAAPALGEADPDLRARLVRAGVPFDAAAALAGVPLVLVAWADGRLDPAERRAVHAALAALGLPEGSPAVRALEAWLVAEPPASLRAAWGEAVRAVGGALSAEARQRLRDGLLGPARVVAEAAGGFLGVGTVSRSEESLLAALSRDVEAAGPFRGPGALSAVSRDPDAGAPAAGA